jgi:hypothetical protein
MDSIHTHQDLLIDLAGNGDPTAFYTLIAQYANAAYIAERNVGKSHKDVLSILVPFIKSAYQDFIKTSPHKAFDTWYREYKRKYFANTQESSDEVNLSEKNDFGNIPMADIAHFERILDLILQRKYGKIKRMWGGRLTGKSRRQIRLLKTAAVIVSIGMVFVLFYGFLSLTKQRLIITYALKDSSFSLSLPFSSTTDLFVKGFSPNRIVNNEQGVPDTLKRAALLLHDTLKIHDTIRVFSRWNSSQNKAPSAVSPGNVNANSPTQTTKPSVPPSGGSKPAVSSIPSPPATVPSPAPAIQGPAKTVYDSLQ